MPHNPPQRKNRSAESAFFFNLRLQYKVLDPRPYLSAMGGTCDREELARITRGKSRGIGDEQYTHYHGLAPCFLKTPWKRVWFNLSIPFPRPLIHAQTHPNSSTHVQRVLTVKPIFKEKLNVILVHLRYWFYRRGSRKPGIWKQHLDRNCAKLINQTDVRTFKQHVLAKKVPNHPKKVKFPH